MATHSATHCNSLQQCAMHHGPDTYTLEVKDCNKLQQTATDLHTWHNRLQQTATDCNRLQQTATDCNRLQQTATDWLQQTYRLHTYRLHNLHHRLYRYRLHKYRLYTCRLQTDYLVHTTDCIHTHYIRLHSDRPHTSRLQTDYPPYPIHHLCSLTGN